MKVKESMFVISDVDVAVNTIEKYWVDFYIDRDVRLCLIWISDKEFKIKRWKLLGSKNWKRFDTYDSWKFYRILRRELKKDKQYFIFL